MYDSVADFETPAHLLTTREYQDLAIKGLDSTWPCAIYNTGAYPLSSILVWPTPGASGATHLALYLWTPLSTFATLTTNVAFPEGYLPMLWYNLAVWQAPMYEKPVPAAVALLAAETKAAIKRLNLDVPRLRTDFPSDDGVRKVGFQHVE